VVNPSRDEELVNEQGQQRVLDEIVAYADSALLAIEELYQGMNAGEAAVVPLDLLRRHVLGGGRIHDVSNGERRMVNLLIEQTTAFVNGRVTSQ